VTRRYRARCVPEASSGYFAGAPPSGGTIFITNVVGFSLGPMHAQIRCMFG
jgi:hypothetical protein